MGMEMESRRCSAHIDDGLLPWLGEEDHRARGVGRVGTSAYAHGYHLTARYEFVGYCVCPLATVTSAFPGTRFKVELDSAARHGAMEYLTPWGRRRGAMWTGTSLAYPEGVQCAWTTGEDPPAVGSKPPGS